MADSYSVQIGEPAQLTLDEQVSWDLRAFRNTDEQGRVRHVDVFITVRGRVVEDDAATVIDEIRTRFEEVQLNLTPVTVLLFRNAEEEFRFEPGTSFAGTPRIEGFTTEPESGQGESHWGYQLDIYVKAPGNVFGGASELQTSIEETRNRKGQIIQKIWRASAKHRTVEAAFALVAGFAPPTTDVVEKLEVFRQEARATGVWIWEAPSKQLPGKVFFIAETVTITGGGEDFIEDTQVDGEANIIPPVLHEARGTARIITIRGSSFGLVAAEIEPPDPHFTQSEDLVRATGREVNGDVVLDDVETSTFRLDWMEVWIFTGTGDIPDLNHGEHLDLIFESPPPDGAIGSS